MDMLQLKEVMKTKLDEDGFPEHVQEYLGYKVGEIVYSGATPNEEPFRAKGKIYAIFPARKDQEFFIVFKTGSMTKTSTYWMAHIPEGEK